MNIFDIIGPVMIGPSSSHTAGAVRLGNIARNILGEEPKKATIILYNSFAKTGKGHGTDKALVAGLLGYKPDDDKIRNVFENAREYNLVYEFIDGDIKPEFHPNTVKFVLEGQNTKTEVMGSSIGGGNVLIFSIDGFSTEFSGNYNTVITVHKDKPGMISRVTSFLAENCINIAQMKVSRESRGEKALMIIETDEIIPEKIRLVLQEVNDIYKALVIRPV